MSLDCFNNIFSTDIGTPEKNLPLLGEVNYGEINYTFRALNFSISASCYTEVSTVYDITINIASLSAYTLVGSTIGSPNTAEKGGAREGGSYNSNTRCYCNGKLPNVNICLKRTLCFFNGCTTCSSPVW